MKLIGLTEKIMNNQSEWNEVDLHFDEFYLHLFSFVP